MPPQKPLFKWGKYDVGTIFTSESIKRIEKRMFSWVFVTPPLPEQTPNRAT